MGVNHNQDMLLLHTLLKLDGAQGRAHKQPGERAPHRPGPNRQDGFGPRVSGVRGTPPGGCNQPAWAEGTIGTVLFVPSVSIVPPVPIIPKMHLIYPDVFSQTSPQWPWPVRPQSYPARAPASLRLRSSAAPSRRAPRFV